MKLLNFLFCMVLGSLAMIVASILGLIEAFKPVKYLAPVLLLGILFTSCEPMRHDNESKITNGDYTYRVIVIDGCEHLYRSFDRGGVMAHKGNCSNPIHEHNH